MFFILSKLLSFLLKPLGLAFVLLFFALRKMMSQRAKKLIIAAMTVLYVFSNGLIVNELYLLWEPPPTLRADLGTYDVGIVLTGGMVNEFKTPVENLYAGAHSDRFLQALLLYQEKKIRKILISGGFLSTNRPSKLSESDLTARILAKCGVRPEDIIVENKARNTYENAKFSAKILKEKMPNERYLLITSASHLPRAEACFRKQGIEVTPYGTDYRSADRSFYIAGLLPDEVVLAEAKLLIHEFWGYIIYKVVGYA